MQVFFHDQALVLDNVRVKVVVMEAPVVLQIEWVTFDVYVFDQVREFAFLQHVFHFLVFDRDLTVVFKVLVFLLFSAFIFIVVLVTIASKLLR
jgi:hypothetical protein